MLVPDKQMSIDLGTICRCFVKIKFKTETITFDAILNNSLASVEIASNLPIKSKLMTWGDEIYFDTGISVVDQFPLIATQILQFEQ